MTTYIGIDIGGTFTDCAVLDGEGRILTIAKSPTRRGEPDRGVVEAVAAAARRLGIGLEDLLADCRFLIHGCTVATNAIVERRGVRTALITTRGHEEAIFIGKASQKIAGLTTGEMTHQSHFDKADPPIIARRHALGVAERVDRDGRVVVALDMADVDAAIDIIEAEGIEAVAICFLWSFLNPDHEKRVLARLRERLPDLYACASHDIAPLIGEYERVATTVANAYVAPKLTTYIARLEQRLAEQGYRYPLLLAHCMGGLTTMEEVRALPLLTLDSGPVSGVLGARHFGAVYGEPNIICADMGGTTFDVALIEGGHTILDEEPVVDRYTCLIPKVAVESVGAGGGSIVWVDENGLLRVGPQSAGAEPGPACYGRGGTAPTVTDVNLVLGIIDPAAFLGGEMQLDPMAAERAVDAVAAQIGMDRIATAAGAFRIVNAHMADLMRRTSIDRGRDPRDFVLFAYGGAGPLHIAYLARELGIAKVYVPSFATVFSALGMLTGGLLHSAERSFATDAPISEATGARMAADFAALRAQLDDLFTREGVAEDQRRYDLYVHMKYRLQPRALPVRLDGPADDPATWAKLPADFELAYRGLYGANAGYSAAGMELVKLRVDGSAATVLPSLTAEALHENPDPSPALKTRRMIRFAELAAPIEALVYDGDRLVPGMRIAGPAVVERMGDTIVLPSFADAEVDGFHNVVLRIALR